MKKLTLVSTACILMASFSHSVVAKEAIDANNQSKEVMSTDAETNTVDETPGDAEHLSVAGSAVSVEEKAVKAVEEKASVVKDVKETKKTRNSKKVQKVKEVVEPVDVVEVTFLNDESSAQVYPFSEAVKLGNVLYLSGQIGIIPETTTLTTGGVVAETKQILVNIKRTLEKYEYTMSDVIKCTVMLADIKDFQSFNLEYMKHFSYPYPTRSTFAVNGLALKAQIEIECIAAK